MADNSFFVGECPNCGSKVPYHDGDNSVTCFACDQIVNVKDLFSNKSNRNEESRESNDSFGLGGLGVASILMSNQTPDSQLAYIENVYEMYDWDSYKKESQIEITEIKDCVKETKLKYANDANTWVIEFKSVIVPITKKLEGLKEIGTKLAEKYSNDKTKLFDDFDLYARIVRALVNKRDYFIKLLNIDIENAAKYGLDSKKLTELKTEFSDVKAKLEELNVVLKLQEVPEVTKVVKKKEEEYAKEKSSEGINVIETYNSAVESFMFDTSKERALRLFSSIEDFRDSRDYIKLIGRWFVFENYCEVAGQGYAILQTKKQNLLDLKNLKDEGKKKGKKTEEQVEQEAPFFGYDIYQVVNNVPSENPIVKNISDILYSYRGKLFYVEKNANICVFDGFQKTTSVVVPGKKGDFILDKKEISLNSNCDKLYIKRKLALKFNKKGCAFSKKQEVVVDLNNYELIMLDCEHMSFNVAVDEMIDIIKVSNNMIFYKKAETKGSGKDKETEIFTYIYNCNTGETKKMSECEIDAVIDGKLIYSTYEPTSDNKSLFVSDLETGDAQLIENNVYEFFKAVGDRVYYVVGSRRFTTLFSNNLEGTDRKQILTNVRNVVYVSDSWIYLLKGDNFNKVLVKLSLDGEKKYVIASAIKNIISTKSIDEYIYYIDIYDTLHVVRSDGKGDKIITYNMTGTTIVDSSYIYFSKVDEYYTDGNVVSLYMLDMDGRNIKKVSYDILGFREYNDNSLLVLKQDMVTIECKTPVKKDVSTTVRNNYHVQRYYVIDKYSLETKNVLTTGLPDLKVEAIKVGCRKTKNVEYKEIKYVPVYNTEISDKAGNNFIEKASQVQPNQKTGCGRRR